MNPKEMIDVSRALAASRGAYREYRDGWICPVLVAPGLVRGLEAAVFGPEGTVARHLDPEDQFERRESLLAERCESIADAMEDR